MGGVLIWGTVLFLSIFFYIINIFFPESFIGNLNFLTREQTLLPLGAMIIAAVIGLLDDYLNIKQIGPNIVFFFLYQVIKNS